MSHKYAYQALMAEHNLKESDLNQDAKIGIDVIMHVEKSINLLTKTGKKINPKVYAKIKANDKWICNEILDTLNDTSKNSDHIPHDKKDLTGTVEGDGGANTDGKDGNEGGNEGGNDGAADDKNGDNSADVKKAMQINADFKLAYEGGKTTITLEELKGVSKTAYDLVFDTYNEDDENGVCTWEYELIETDKEIFTLTKN